MLNLNQVQAQIHSPGLTPIQPDPTTWLGLSECYRQLKVLGWVCHNEEIHLVERVPIFRLEVASIRRDKQAPGYWIVELPSSTYRVSGDLAQITAEAQLLLAEVAAASSPLDAPMGLDVPMDETQIQETQPAPLSTARQIALDLKTEYRDYPELLGRIDKALELVEKGVVEFPHYGTTFDPATYYGNYSCDCPDSVNRQPRAKFGIACKHAIAMEIHRRMQVEGQAMAYRKLTDRFTMSRLRDRHILQSEVEL